MQVVMAPEELTPGQTCRVLVMQRRGARCWLSSYTNTDCSGRLQVVHLISQQTIKRELRARLEAPLLTLAVWDPRVCVRACERHHGALDTARSLKLLRKSLPAGVEEFAKQYGLEWWLDREYGSRLGV